MRTSDIARNGRAIAVGFAAAICGAATLISGATDVRAEQPKGAQHPDLSGFWMLNRTPESSPRHSPPDLPEGWRMFGTADMPGPQLQPWAYAIVKQQRIKEDSAVKISDGLDRQTARCQAGGFPDLLTFDNPLDIMQRPDEILMVTERERQLPRHIYISPPHPLTDVYDPAKNGIATHNGRSLGRWDGNTLVVTTTGFNAEPWMFSIERVPHSDAMTTLERLSLSADGSVLTDALQINDPKVLTAVWNLKLTWHRAPAETEAVESSCEIDNDFLGIKPN